MRKLLFFICIFLPLVVGAQNPIIRDQFTADPTARVFNGKVYLYPSHDIISPIEPERKWFAMADYHVFSSEDLIDWTDHGVILSQEDVPWGNPKGYAMWAPCCVEKGGKYYFYFPNAPKSGRGFAVGVAVGNHPEGPFTPQAESIKGVTGIDPCVLIDKDGQSYIYWSGRGLRVAKLKDNMLELDGESIRLDEQLPQGFKEGPFAFERNGKYYLTYPWVQDRTETIAYAMSDNPMGPFQFKGIIMEQSPSACWTNHHSIVEYKGEWYFFYHHNDYSPTFDKNRSARVDKILFNEDGTILPVTPTYRGVGITPARSTVQLDRYTMIHPTSTSLEFINPENTFEGWYVKLNAADRWVQYNTVDFTEISPKSITVRVRSTVGGTLSFTAKEEAPFATVAVPKSKEWKEITVNLNQEVTGIQHIRAILKAGADVDIDWVKFN